jgi:hypothetical protein
MHHISHKNTYVPWFSDCVWLMLLCCCDESKKLSKNYDPDCYTSLKEKKLDLERKEMILECRNCKTQFHFIWKCSIG